MNLNPLRSDDVDSMSERYLKFYSKLHLIGKIGRLLYGFLFSVCLLGLALMSVFKFTQPNAKLTDSISFFDIGYILIGTVLSFNWYLIFRRFKTDELLSPQTALLIGAAALLSFTATLLEGIIPGSEVEGFGAILMIGGLIEGITIALPLIAFALVIKFAAELKSEHDLTV